MDQTGELLPWIGGPTGPQITPSEFCWDLHKRADALAVGSSGPSTGATAAPAQETPTEEPPVM